MPTVGGDDAGSLKRPVPSEGESCTPVHLMFAIKRIRLRGDTAIRLYDVRLQIFM